MAPRPVALVVDDDEDVRQMLVEILEAEGFDVRTAADGEAGLEQFRRVRPAVVFLDISARDFSGPA